VSTHSIYILGVGMTPFGRHPDLDVKQLTRWAVNAALKDNHGGNAVRVRGHQKVICHLMFGILAITVQQIFRLVT